jgi:hypothetical protein
MTRVFLLVVAACGPTSHPPVHVEPGVVDAGVVITTPVDPPTDAECTEVITHAVALGVAETHEKLAPDVQARIVADLVSTELAGCKVLPRSEVRCGLAATTVAAMGACQASFKSSTSNSSVAPPGISPPAPRSP